MVSLLFRALGERYPVRRDILTVDEAVDYLTSRGVP